MSILVIPPTPAGAEIRCDQRTGELANYGHCWERVTAHTVADALAIASARGWYVSPAKDLCPKCLGKKEE